MKERPILFGAPMVRAILDGTKTQTRRLVKFNPAGRVSLGGKQWHIEDPGVIKACPYGQPRDRLWVRETFLHEPADYCWEASVSIPCRPAHTVYRADSDPTGKANGAAWTPSIHMPRALSRITLEITGVRVERLKEISSEDCFAEGIDTEGADYNEGENYWNAGSPVPPERWAFSGLWNSTGGDWEANPWVWVIEFKRVDAKDRS